MKGTPVTIKDIAKALNISISTVSRALRGMPEIHESTRTAVIKLAEELDYQPNQLAKNLAKSRTKTIGVIVPNLSYYFFSAALNSIEEAAMQAGYSVMVCQSNESYLREVTNIQNLLRGQVEGFIISLARDTNDYSHIHKLMRKEVPLVLFDRYADEIEATKVIVNNKEAAFKATEHLLENGCKKIGFLAGPPNLLISTQRLMGYKEALEKHGIAFSNTNVFHTDFTQDNTVIKTLEMMSTLNPDGIVAVSDRIAFSAMFALKQKGLRIPEDVAVVSFNNEPICTLLSPTLSSVSQPVQEMGTEVVRLLLRQIENEHKLPVETKILETNLIVRESSARK
ncbi:transcriptional regulator, LacI family [Pseudarcicella hirudinis]|uniref:Transcriptional regulator, LacI family n=1 Tax=Pseudarcicella hirudinis TaxID=1079859 RepID=A0A1I5NND2_9BACT|nr:LacI family DNA-binding transcriptional regulator [Pseudarcicella hirudinis]SFP23232.1 transcriptional regulator, LacI family [Pseudarcicella hirudinis]